MAWVVFMRGVNVGKHKRFSAAALAKSLSDLDVTNIGAAGTFVVRKTISEPALCKALRAKVPFDVDLMLCRRDDVLKLSEKELFLPHDGAAQRFVTIMSQPPRTPPKLPIAYPPGDNWQVQITGIVGNMACSIWRKPARGSPVYPNEVIEKLFGGKTTTRNWNTIAKIRQILKTDETADKRR